MIITDEMRECIESCLYTFASLVVMHGISERQKDVDQCLEMIESGIRGIGADSK
jgi:hypothetical protein